MPCSKSVSSGLSFNRSDTLPNSVVLPVPTTSAVAVPLTTWVPIQSALDRCPRGVSAGSTAAAFSTGNVSPVSMASSTNRSLDSRTSPSPGTTSPAFRMTISPGTISSTGISLELPSRRTAALIRTMESSLSTAFDAPRSCQNPSKPLMTTMNIMTPASTRSPRSNDNPVATNRMRMIGFPNCLSRSDHTSDRFGGLSRFAP